MASNENMPATPGANAPETPEIGVPATPKVVQKKHGFWCRMFNSNSRKSDPEVEIYFIDEGQFNRVMEQTPFDETLKSNEFEEILCEEAKAPISPLAEEYARKQHGLYCRLFRKDYEQREALRVKRREKWEAKEQARREKYERKYALTQEQYAELWKRVEEHRERQKRLFYPDEKVPEYSYPTENGKKLHDYISAGTSLRY